MTSTPRAPAKRPRSKRHKVARGDVFLVPLSDGTATLGQVLDVTPQVMNSVLCALFGLRGSRPRIDVALPDEKTIVAVQFVTPESFKQGMWPVVRNDEVYIDANRYLPVNELAAKNWVGAKIIGSGIVESLMNAYFSLRAWDDWYVPNYLDSLLAPGVPRPSGVKLVKS